MWKRPFCVAPITRVIPVISTEVEKPSAAEMSSRAKCPRVIPSEAEGSKGDNRCLDRLGMTPRKIKR